MTNYTVELKIRKYKKFILFIFYIIIFTLMEIEEKYNIARKLSQISAQILSE